MKPLQLFWIIVIAGLAGLLIAFFSIRASNTSKLEAPRPDVVEESKKQETTEKIANDISDEEPIIIKELVEAEEEESEEGIISSEAGLEGRDAESLALKLKEEKVTHYHNAPIGYGMLVPYGTYYSGFGPQEGARHSVGFSSTGVPDTFEDAEVRVLYYGDEVLSELENANFYQDPESATTYLRILDVHSIVIQSDSLENPVLQSIIETIYVGPSLEDIEKEGEESSEEGDE